MIDKRKWNSTLTTCYTHRLRCTLCPNNPYCLSCSHTNEYNIKNAKYSLIKIYAEYGRQGVEQLLGRPIVEPTVISNTR